jgi:16S rRNA (cytosine967-C5)-methyltransferase
MNLHRPWTEAVIAIVHDVVHQQRYADKAIARVFKEQPRLTLEAREWVAATAYDIIRYLRLLSFTGNSTGLWKMLGAWAIARGYALPEWKEFKGLRPDDVRARWQQARATRALRESIPDWLDDVGTAQLGPAWNEVLPALNQPAQLYLRTNTLQSTAQELQRQLKEEGITATTVAGYPQALRVPAPGLLYKSVAFQQGLCEVQDVGSQAIGLFVGAEPGMRVIDACAGAGGKTLHLAACMQNKGRLLALDTAARKLETLKKRARRAGIHNLEARVIESSKTLKSLSGTADRLLLDVPCSGLGVLKRNPDIKWKLHPADLERLQHLQHDILWKYAGLVKPGGCLVYATCSVLPSENEHQVAEFLQNHSAYALVEEKKLVPSAEQDGFYMALIRRLL